MSLWAPFRKTACRRDSGNLAYMDVFTAGLSEGCHRLELLNIFVDAMQNKYTVEDGSPGAYSA